MWLGSNVVIWQIYMIYMYKNVAKTNHTSLPDVVRTRPLFKKARSFGELPREAERGISLSPSEQFRLRGGRAGGFGLWRGGVAFTLLQVHIMYKSH